MLTTLQSTDLLRGCALLLHEGQQDAVVRQSTNVHEDDEKPQLILQMTWSSACARSDAHMHSKGRHPCRAALAFDRVSTEGLLEIAAARRVAGRTRVAAIAPRPGSVDSESAGPMEACLANEVNALLGVYATTCAELRQSVTAASLSAQARATSRLVPWAESAAARLLVIACWG